MTQDSSQGTQVASPFALHSERLDDLLRAPSVAAEELHPDLPLRLTDGDGFGACRHACLDELEQAGIEPKTGARHCKRRLGSGKARLVAAKSPQILEHRTGALAAKVLVRCGDTPVVVLFPARVHFRSELHSDFFHVHVETGSANEAARPTLGSHFQRGHSEVVELIDRAEWLGVPSIVLGELWMGFQGGRSLAKNQNLRNGLVKTSVSGLPLP